MQPVRANLFYPARAPWCVRRAFTLMEMILALVIAVAIGALGMALTTGLGNGPDFDEGVERFQTLLRQARADACIQGRRIQLRFLQDPEDGASSGIEIAWEPEPLEDPGLFVPYAHCPFEEMVPDGSLVVLACELIGESAYTTLLSQQLSGESDDGLDPLTFDRDGSCDAAVLLLAPVDPQSPRRVILQVLPAAESFQAFAISVDEEEEYLQAARDGQSLQDLHFQLHPPLEYQP